MSMFARLLSSINKLQHDTRDLLRQSGTFIVSLMPKLLQFCNVFYAYITCTITSKYFSNFYMYPFCLFFVFITFAHIVLTHKKQHPKLQKILKIMINICMFFSICLTLSCLVASLKFVYTNKDALKSMHQGFLALKTTRLQSLFGWFKILAPVLATFYMVYKRIMDYFKMSNYNHKVKYNILTGEELVDSPMYDSQFPFASLFVTILSFFTSFSPVVFLASFVDIILGTTDFIGHKKNNLLLHTIMNCVIPVYALVRKFVDIIWTGNIYGVQLLK